MTLQLSLRMLVWSMLATLVLVLVGIGETIVASQSGVTLAVVCAPTTGEMLQPVEGWGLRASGGAPPHTFAIPRGELPSGLTLDATSGRISGTLDGRSGGRKTYTAKVIDSRGAVAERE